ncbi:MAG: hypothetical protein QF823_06020 [Candidatus Marinimicrobia bacterium]|nr:hypothetical protein [Candidatus Neomarinimicrobiota bacterium]
MGFGARSLAMGGAFTALGNDPSGMYWNPAGLAGMTNGAFYFESSNLGYTNKTTYIDNTTQNPLNVGRFNGLGVAIPLPTIRGSMVVGIGFNRILHYDGLMSFSGFSIFDNQLSFPIELDGKEQFYDFSKNVNRSETVLNGGALEQLTFSFGIALSSTSFGGLSISRVSGRETYSFEFSQEDSQNEYGEFPADFKQYDLQQTLVASTKALNFRLGVKTAVTDWFRIGMAVSLPYHIKVVENHSTDEILLFDNGDKSDASVLGNYDYRVRTPMVLDLGGALIIGNLAVSGSMRYRDWSATRFNLDDFNKDSEDYELLQDENALLALNYRAVSQVRGGAEYLLEFNDNFGLSLRGGVAVFPSPKGKAAEDRMIISAGVGIPVGDNIMLDAAFLSTAWSKISSDIYTPYGTTEDVHANRILVNFSYLF